MTNTFLSLFFLITFIVSVIGLQAIEESRNNLLLRRYNRDENGNLIDLNKEPSPEHNITKGTSEGKQIDKNQLEDKANPTLKTNPEAKSRYKILNPRRPIIVPVSLNSLQLETLLPIIHTLFKFFRKVFRKKRNKFSLTRLKLNVNVKVEKCK